MIIRYYEDNGSLIKEVKVSVEEERALSVAMASMVEWHENFLKHRIKQEINNIVEKALEPGSKLLTREDKQQLRKLLDQYNVMVVDPKNLPDEIKKEIVKRANLNLLKSERV